MTEDFKKSRKSARIVNDSLSLRLWSHYVTSEEQNDLIIMESLLAELKKEPYPGKTDNQILKRMHEDGAGFDGLNAAIMTYGYLEHICLHYINKIKKRTPH